MINITLGDGTVLTGENWDQITKGYNTHETEKKLLAQKRETERKAKEEQEKKIKLYQTEKLAEINDRAKALSDLVKEYEKVTKHPLYYTIGVDGSLLLKETLSLDNGYDDIFKIVRRYL